MFVFLKFISKTKKSTVQSVIQCRTRFFSKLVKVIGFCDSFLRNGSNDIIHVVLDGLASENFSNPARAISSIYVPSVVNPLGSYLL